MKLKRVLGFCSLLFALFSMTGCITNSQGGAGELNLDEMYDRMTKIRTLIDTSEVGSVDNTYPKESMIDLQKAYEDLALGLSKAKAGQLFLQFEVNNYVIAADKAIASFLNSLQITVPTGTSAELIVYGVDKKGRIEFGSSPDFGAGQQWTVECWIKYDAGFFEYAIGDFVSTFFSKSDGGIEGWMINFMGSGLRTTIGMGPQKGRVFEWSGNYPTNYGTWHHVATVYDGNAASGQLKMYLDGNLFWSKDNDIKDGGGVLQSYQPNTDDLRMWAFQRPSNPDCCMTGYLKKFRKWSKVKSQSEVQSLMSSEVQGDESGLVFAWDFTKVPEDGTNIPDKTGKFSAKIVGNHKWIELK